MRTKWSSSKEKVH